MVFSLGFIEEKKISKKDPTIAKEQKLKVKGAKMFSDNISKLPMKWLENYYQN